MGQKKVNKANDAFKLQKAKGFSNKKSEAKFGAKNIYHPST